MNDEAWETRGGALRVIPAETRLTVYRRRPVFLFREVFVIDLEVLESSKKLIWSALKFNDRFFRNFWKTHPSEWIFYSKPAVNRQPGFRREDS